MFNYLFDISFLNNYVNFYFVKYLVCFSLLHRLVATLTIKKHCVKLFLKVDMKCSDSLGCIDSCLSIFSMVWAIFFANSYIMSCDNVQCDV